MSEVAKLLGIELDEEFRLEGCELTEKFKLTTKGLHSFNGKWRPSNELERMLKGELKIASNRPKKGEIYWCPLWYVDETFGDKYLLASPREWTDSLADLKFYEKGMCYKTQKECFDKLEEDCKKLEKERLK